MESHHEEPLPNKGELILYQTEDGKTKIEVRLQDETVWLSQKLMVEQFRTPIPNINMHVGHIFEEGELTVDSVIKGFLITAADGKTCQTKFYNLDVISHYIEAIEKVKRLAEPPKRGRRK